MKRFLLWSVGAIFGLFIVYIMGYLALYYVSTRPEFTTEELPKAYLNQPYYAKINIEGMVANKDTTIYSSSSDIMAEPKVYETHKDIYNEPIYGTNYSELTIMGTPTKIDSITIQLNGRFYDAMFSGKEFEKTYTIEVVE